MTERIGRRKGRNRKEAAPDNESGIIILRKSSFSFPLEAGGGDGEYAGDTHEYLVTIATTTYREDGKEHTSHHFTVQCQCCQQKLVRGPYLTSHGLVVTGDWTNWHGTLQCSHQPGVYLGTSTAEASTELAEKPTAPTVKQG